MYVLWAILKITSIYIEISIWCLVVLLILCIYSNWKKHKKYLINDKTIAKVSIHSFIWPKLIYIFIKLFYQKLKERIKK